MKKEPENDKRLVYYYVEDIAYLPFCHRTSCYYLPKSVPVVFGQLVYKSQNLLTDSLISKSH